MVATGYTGGSGGNLVTSVFGRQGAVIAQALDYSASQLGGGSFAHGVGPNVVTLIDAATITVDAAAGNHLQVTIAGNRTLGNPSNAVDGQGLVFEIVQGAGGSHLLALDTKYQLAAGLVVTLSTAAGARDYLGVIYDATSDRFNVVAFAAGL